MIYCINDLCPEREHCQCFIEEKELKSGTFGRFKFVVIEGKTYCDFLSSKKQEGEVEEITIKMEKLKSGWVNSQAYDSKGNLLLREDGSPVEHTSSSEAWAKHDMTEFQKDRYWQLFPAGWIVSEFKLIE